MRKTTPTRLLTFTLALLLAGCQSANINQGTARAVNERGGPAVTQSGLPAAPVIGSLDYRVGPMDVLDIEVFGSAELTRSVRIAAGGEFTLPLVGPVQAQGKTVSELQVELAKRLAEKYIENPQVTVFVKEYMSQRVTVEGAVKNPGIYSLTGRTSLLQIMALSGGLDQDANPGGIIVYRTLGDKRHAAVFDLRKVRNGELIDPEILGNDMVVIDYSGTRSNLRDFLMATPIMAVFLAF